MSIPGEHFDSLASIEKTYFWHRLRLLWIEALIKKHFTDPSNLNVVDYGCGTGWTLSYLNNKMNFKSCMGLDGSKQAIDLARQHGSFYHLIDPDTVKIPKEADLVLALDVIEHIEDDRAFVDSLMRDASSVRRIMISVPSMPSLYSPWDRALGHYRRYSKRSLTALIQSVGLRVTFISYAFSFLMPAAYWRKMTFSEDQGIEFPEISPRTNAMLVALGKGEHAFSGLVLPPIGTSLFAVVE